LSSILMRSSLLSSHSLRTAFYFGFVKINRSGQFKGKTIQANATPSFQCLAWNNRIF
jgi:hypothetical protein